MNEILQKRIEEKSKELGQMFFPDNINVFARPNWEAGYIETACKEISTFALQNQWISVEEGLPKEKFDDGYQFVFVRIHLYDDTFYYDTDYIRKGKWELHKNQEITHWMLIPSLKGGEE